MTTAASVPIQRHDGNDSAVSFPFDHYIATSDELVVTHKTTAGVVTTPILDTDYTVVIAPDTGYATVAFPIGGSTYSTLASGSPAERLTFTRNTDKDRTTDIDGSHQFSVLNDDGDKRTRIEQEILEIVSRCAQQSPSNSDAVPTLEAVLAGTAALDINSLDALGALLDAHVLHVNDGADKKVTAAVILAYVEANISGFVANPMTATLNANSKDVDNAKAITFIAEVANSGSSPQDIDWGDGQKQKFTLSENTTLTFTAPDGPGNFLLKVVQGGTGSYTITWPGTVKWPDSGTIPTLSTAVGAIDIISFYYDGTNYYGQASTDFQTPP
jgi:hypothetical protein